MGMAPAGWVAGLVAESFFVACPAHQSHKKNERNIFCLACCASICPHCASAHRHHPLLQTYTINSAKVIFLKPRPQSRPFKGSGNICLTCDRILQEPFHFCSLSCKVDHVMMQGGDLSNILQYYGGGAAADPNRLAFPRFENLRVDGSDLDDDTDGGQVTPNSTLEDPTHHYGNGGGGGSSDNGDDARVDGGGEVAKRKKGGGFFPKIVLSLGGGGNRRKGAPQRSPLA